MVNAPASAVTLQYHVVVVKAPGGRFEAYVRAFPALHVVDSSPAGAIEQARAEIARLVNECARDGRRLPAPDREAVAIELVTVAVEPQAQYRTSVQIEITTGKIYRDTVEVPLRGTALALIVTLATEPRDASIEALCDRLYPDIPADQAYSALKMCVHRARKQIGVRDIIVTTERGYRLSEAVIVDVRFLPSIVRSVRARSIAKTIESRLDSIFEQLVSGRPAAFAAWEWFEPIERELRASAREIGLYLAGRALREGNTERALERARAVAVLDPLDETALELEIRVHLSRGDRSSAVNAFRRYAGDLQTQHGMEPSPALRTLVE